MELFHIGITVGGNIKSVESLNALAVAITGLGTREEESVIDGMEYLHETFFCHDQWLIFEEYEGFPETYDGLISVCEKYDIPYTSFWDARHGYPGSVKSLDEEGIRRRALYDEEGDIIITVKSAIARIKAKSSLAELEKFLQSMLDARRDPPHLSYSDEVTQYLRRP